MQYNRISQTIFMKEQLLHPCYNLANVARRVLFSGAMQYDKACILS